MRGVSVADRDTREGAIERTAACPQPGVIPAFDAGWNAHEIGLERETVRVLSASPEWALLGYNIRAKLAEADRG